MIAATVEQYGYRIHISDTQIGNMGAPVTAYRAFCTCYWSSPRTTDEKVIAQWVNDHLAGHRR